MAIKRLLVGLTVLLGTYVMVPARGFESGHDSLPPWIEYYNKLKGEPKLVPFFPDFNEPESLNVRLVGKWGRGPAARVTGRDSLVYVSMGSEVCVFNCADASNPRVISEIQCRYVVDKAILKDTFLYAVLQGGVEVFNIANPRSVTRIKYLNISAVDMCIEDSLAYTIDADSFKVYKLIRPDSFSRLGACADSGYYLAVNQGFGYACDRWGLYVIDATNPASPHRATILTVAQTGAAWVDGDYCYYTTEIASPSTFRIANISDPYHPVEVGHVDGISGYDIYKTSFFVYLPGFQVIDASQPGNPSVLSTLTFPGEKYGVWTRSPYSHSFVASDYEGLTVINIVDPVHPVVDTATAGASYAYDCSISGDWSYVANWEAGMKILDIANAAAPIQVGSYDTTGLDPEASAVSVRDSFAYLVTQFQIASGLKAIDVSVPVSPRLASARAVADLGRATVLRDSLLYVAEDYHFEIFSIANPRSPRLVGSCGLPYRSYDLCIRDSIAFVANISSLQIISIADPSSPQVIGSCSGTTAGVAVKDSFAFVAGIDLRIVNIANLSAPFLAATCTIPENAKCIAIDGNTAFVGECPYTRRLRVFDISNPVGPLQVGYYDMPDRTWQVSYVSPYLYAACLGAGICILETIATGIEERSPALSRSIVPRLSCWPNPTDGLVAVSLEGAHNRNGRLGLFDRTGRLVRVVAVSLAKLQSAELDLTNRSPGVYFISWEGNEDRSTVKLVKR